MAKRRKRLEKGIESLETQIDIHGVKKEQASKENKPELVGYYEKEIFALEENKKRKLEKMKKVRRR